jgi:hypothetical protein
VLFSSASQASPDDLDARQDLFVWSGGAIRLVSIGPDGGNGPFDVCQPVDYPTPCRSATISRDGTRVYFITQESLLSTDADSHDDVYERSGSTTRLISAGPSSGGTSVPAEFADASDDGSHVFFFTDRSLVPADTDPLLDLYERSGNVTSLVSTGPYSAYPIDVSRYVDVSSDGTRVFFETNESLTLDDNDYGRLDIYERSNGTTTLATKGTQDDISYGWDASRDGSSLVFMTLEPLVPEDVDTGACVDYDEYGNPNGARPCEDVYEYSNGLLKLVSTGPIGGGGGSDAEFPLPPLRSVSDDGDHVFFSTAEPLVSEDGDTATDVYERSGGETTLTSTGPKDADGPSYTTFRGASVDGSRVFFRTSEQLVSGDTDSAEDYYERAGSRTTLVLGNVGQLGQVSEDGSHVSFETGLQLLPEDSDSCPQSPYPPRPCFDVYAASIGPATAGGYARPRGTKFTRIALVPAYRECTSGNAGHGSPLASPSCSPPAQSSGFLTVGSPDANRAAANSAGYLSFTVIGESPIDLANGDQADVRIRAQLTDVRRKSDLLDYGGELRVAATVRLTDGDYKGAPITDPPQTASDLPFGFVVPCTPIAEAAKGSTCVVSTSADAIVPGIATEGLRSVWQLGSVEVFDGGSDGDADTTNDDTLFAHQGLFAP